jgi:hypothetical protein
VAGRKNNPNGELAAYLADLKKSEALKASQAPEIRRYLEQLNSVQGDILNRLRTLSASPAGGGDTLGKRLAWGAGIGLGLLLIGFLLGTLIESRKENEHLSSVHHCSGASSVRRTAIGRDGPRSPQARSAPSDREPARVAGWS